MCHKTSARVALVWRFRDKLRRLRNGRYIYLPSSRLRNVTNCGNRDTKYTPVELFGKAELVTICNRLSYSGMLNNWSHFVNVAITRKE